MIRLSAPGFPLIYLCFDPLRVHIKFNPWPNKSSYLCQALSYFKILQFCQCSGLWVGYSEFGAFFQGFYGLNVFRPCCPYPMAFPCALGPAASMFTEGVKEKEDRRGPALDLLWVTKAFTKKELSPFYPYSCSTSTWQIFPEHPPDLP